jgi:hypothetical protein
MVRVPLWPTVPQLYYPRKMAFCDPPLPPDDQFTGCFNSSSLGFIMAAQPRVPNLPSTCNHIQYSQKYILTICIKPKLFLHLKPKVIKCCSTSCHGNYRANAMKTIKLRFCTAVWDLSCYLSSQILIWSEERITAKENVDYIWSLRTYHNCNSIKYNFLAWRT